MKKNEKDTLGDILKNFEMAEAGRRLMPLLPVVARIDGRSFSRFTQGMERPFDKRFSQAMINTAAQLVKETCAIIGYTQSDEITLVWYSDDLESQIFFDGRIQKMTSQLGSMATLFFYKEIARTMPERCSLNPTFDARVHNVPTLDWAAKNLLWRERDATKNSISMAARHYFSHASLLHLTGKKMQEKLLLEADVNWNDYPDAFKRGTFVRRTVKEISFAPEEIAELPEKHLARKNPEMKFPRTCFDIGPLPPLGRIENLEDVLFRAAEPVLRSSAIRAGDSAPEDMGKALDPSKTVSEE